MDTSKVIIEIIKDCEKKYITKIQPNSFSYQKSKNPFTDPEVLKFEPDEALKIADKHNPSFDGLSVLDVNGKNLYHRFDEMVNEEIQNFLNEHYVMSNDNLNFKQRLNNSQFHGYETFTSDFDVDIVESDIMVNWKISFWLNDFGVENFIIDVEEVEGNFLLHLRDKQSDEIEQETRKNIQDYNWNFQVDGDVCISKGKSLYISKLEFYFKEGICKVKFK